jgi:uncharacterized protein
MSQRNLWLPPWAAWEHVHGSPCLEVVFIRTTDQEIQFEGITSAGRNGQSWRVDYLLTVNRDWVTRTARITSRNGNLRRSLELDAHEDGTWRLDGRPVYEVHGCLDVDLETSALTNALPIRRLGLRPGEAADAPGVYVRGSDLRVERLDQRYRRLPDGEHREYHYEAPRFGFEATITYDRDGLVRDYPGIARRAL